MECCVSRKRQACNYNCATCRKSNKLPNILGKFVVQEDNSIFCTGCNKVFEKEELTKQNKKLN